MAEYISHNHWKGLIQYHIIFICKYRRKIFNDRNIRDRCKELMAICSRHQDFEIVTQEIDPTKPDHYHCLVNVCKPSIAPCQIVRSLKQYSAYHGSLARDFSQLKQYK